MREIKGPTGGRQGEKKPSAFAIMKRVMRIEKPGRIRDVLLALAVHCDGEGNCWPNNRTLAELCHVTERTIQRILARLKATGRVKIESQQTGRGGEANRLIRLPKYAQGGGDSPPRKRVAGGRQPSGQSGERRPENSNLTLKSHAFSDEKGAIASFVEGLKKQFAKDEWEIIVIYERYRKLYGFRAVTKWTQPLANALALYVDDADSFEELCEKPDSWEAVKDKRSVWTLAALIWENY